MDVMEIQAPAVSDGDGGSGSPEAIAAARGPRSTLASASPPASRLPQGHIALGAHRHRGVGSSLAHMSGSGVLLTNSAGVHAEPMADWVVARSPISPRPEPHGVSAAAGSLAKEDFTDGAVPMREFRDLRLGVFGLGGIGTAVARRGLALGMKVSGVRRRPERGGPKGMEWVGRMADLARLSGGSDVLVIAAPHTTETVGAVDRRVLERLPHQALSSNVSRGSLSTSRRCSSCSSGGG